MQWGPQERTFAEAFSGRSTASRYNPASMPEIGTPAIKLLVPTVIGYETMVRHNVPGQGSNQAEATYAGLKMDVEGTVPMSIYARAEGYVSPDQARARVEELAKQYPRDGRQATINKLTPGYVGFTPADDAYIVVWVKDSSVTYVKATFLRTPPQEKRQAFLSGTSESGRRLDRALPAHRQVRRRGRAAGACSGVRLPGPPKRSAVERVESQRADPPSRGDHLACRALGGLCRDHLRVAYRVGLSDPGVLHVLPRPGIIGRARELPPRRSVRLLPRGLDAVRRRGSPARHCRDGRGRRARQVRSRSRRASRTRCVSSVTQRTCSQPSRQTASA